MKKFIFIFLWVFVIHACEEIVLVEDISKENVQILAPTNERALQPGESITFSWQPIFGADSYQLQIARPSFDSAVQIVLDSVVYINSYRVDSLKANSYEWRVKGLNSAYETGYSVSGFVVED